jgi:hypothetical protein
MGSPSKTGGGAESTRKTVATGRLFTTNMQKLCKQLEDLLSTVYGAIYGKREAEFTLIPMPRLELESIADLKVLSEIGALNPDLSLQISQIVLGEDMENKRKKMRLQQLQAPPRAVMGRDEVEALKGEGSRKKDAEMPAVGSRKKDAEMPVEGRRKRDAADAAGSKRAAPAGGAH